MAKSGFEALIEALKQSGADMGGFGGQAGPADDGVVDADYTVIDPDDQK